LYRTNDACGVKNAATRKYFTQCHLWYFPPPEKMEMLANYANEHGAPTDRPYFSLDGRTPLTARKWERMRAKWNHTHGVTNVWQEPAVRGKERIVRKGMKSLHANQKPLKLMERIIGASTDPGDVVWEPFGGLCSATVASLRMGRQCYASELIPEYFDVASERIKEVYQELPLYEQKKNS
jgi:site-specific DNA-methyltransferase (adenine-specific)